MVAVEVFTFMFMFMLLPPIEARKGFSWLLVVLSMLLLRSSGVTPMLPPTAGEGNNALSMSDDNGGRPCSRSVSAANPTSTPTSMGVSSSMSSMKLFHVGAADAPEWIECGGDSEDDKVLGELLEGEAVVPDELESSIAIIVAIGS